MTAAPPTDASSAVGRRRRLARLGGVSGVISGIALDHRDSLRALLARRGLALETSELRAVKLALARTLAPRATAIMLDEELGQAALQAGVIPASVGLIMPLEAQGYEAGGDGRTTTLLDQFSPVDALRFGADACKLLVPYRADDAPSSARQEALVIAAVAACHEAGLPLIVEPLVYRWSTESPAAYAEAYRRLVVSAAGRLQPLGADLLKVPFPVHDLAADPDAGPDACRALSEACRETPWVLLGAGTDTETFLDQVRLAGSAGASGFLVGRGIWGPALAEDPNEVERVARAVCRPAFERCRQAGELFARPLALASGG